MRDLISRQDAIDAVNELKKSPWYNNPQNIYRTEAVEVVERLCIRELPSAEKRGRWIEDGHYERCSECGEYADELHNYCPNCGARMED